MELVDQINVVLKQGQAYIFDSHKAEIGATAIRNGKVELGFNGFESSYLEQTPNGFIIHGATHEVHGIIQEVWDDKVRLDLKEYAK